MRLVTYLPPDAPQSGPSYRLAPWGRAAVLTAGMLVDLEAAGRWLGTPLPRTVRELIAGGPELWRRAAAAADEVRAAGAPTPSADVRTSGAEGSPPGSPLLLPADAVRWLAPLPDPPSLRDFSAFEAHVRAGFARRGEDIPPAWYELPAYYKGNHRTILGPDEDIPWPRYTEVLDYELEIAMVVGRPGRDLSPEEAATYIFGYTIMNDVSARDIQAREMQLRLGPAKAKDFATVLGPVLVTRDELDPSALRVRARINGELVTDTTTAAMYWSFAEMLAHVSQDEDVWPGDVYGSGTVPGGCGLEHGRMLQPGDVVELEVDGIGVLRNRVAAPRV